MLFGAQWKESESNAKIKINDVSCEAFEIIQSYCYGVSKNITVNNCIALYYATQKYMFDIMNQLCLNYIKSNVNCNCMLYLLDQCQEFHLSVKCYI